MLPAVWYFCYLMSYYMKTSREAKVRTRIIAAALLGSWLIGFHVT